MDACVAFHDFREGTVAYLKFCIGFHVYIVVCEIHILHLNAYER